MYTRNLGFPVVNSSIEWHLLRCAASKLKKISQSGKLFKFAWKCKCNAKYGWCCPSHFCQVLLFWPHENNILFGNLKKRDLKGAAV